MRPLESSGRAILLSFIAVLVLAASCSAQQVAFVDLSNISPRVEFLRPAPRPSDPTTLGGTMATSDDCDASQNLKNVVKSTLVSLDREDYKLGDQPRFEVRMENAGNTAISIPFSPNRSDVQPSDPSQKFAYSRMVLDLWIGGKRWSSDTGGKVALYGNDASTMITLQPGEWVRIIGRGKLALPEESAEIQPAVDPVTHANVQATLYRDETLLTSTASATSSKKVCIQFVQGESLPLHISAN